MLRVIFVLVLSITALFVRGQALDAYKGRLLRSDSVSIARVQVIEHNSAVDAIKQLSGVRTDDKLKGYRVRIFFDNSQNARSLAADAVSRFHELYPAVPTYMSYENPYFKVTVGNCINMEEAIILKGQIERTFSRAYILREDIPIAKLVE